MPISSRHLLAAAAIVGSTMLCAQRPPRKGLDIPKPDDNPSLLMADESAEAAEAQTDTIVPLTEEDFREVAEELGVETAAIKAVVDIEAGPSHQGFSAPGVPLINFDLSMFRRFAQKRGVNLARYSKSHPMVFSSHKGSQPKANNRLRAAKTINPHAAVEGTFWGMFQIGGFNWKKCGCSSIEEFETRMATSEREQLELFAQFITTTGLVKHLRQKNWAAFSRGYNGPSYASRNYHTRMANAYARHKAREAKEGKEGK